jgi:hypothetical protein
LPSSQALRSQQVTQARLERQEQRKKAVEQRRQQRRAKRLLVINRLSKLWKSGVPVLILAWEFGVRWSYMASHIVRLRKEFPGKFPFRHRVHSHCLSGGAVQES